MANFGIISAELSSLAAKWSCDMTLGIVPFGTGRVGGRAWQIPGRHDVNGTLVNKVITNAGFHTRKDFS